jgi:hypothetical protein
VFDRQLNSYVPSYYRKVDEMDALMEVEQSIVDEYQVNMLTAFQNTFILTADISGIELFETMFSIVANPSTEDLEFRRQRVLNRMTTSPPFTIRFLKQKLDAIIGEGKWKVTMDYANYTLYVEASAVNQNWYTELEFTINQIKPCNIVFVNRPRTDLSLSMTEEISYKTMKWNYILGSWLLGRLPFATIEGAEVIEWYYKLGQWPLGKNPFALTEGGNIIKMATTPSIQDALLQDTAGFVVTDIAAVLINDETKITNFTIKSASGRFVTLEYQVTSAMTSVVTNIKLLKSDDTVLTDSNVYVPVTDTILSRHSIEVKEG